jgi:GAF domain-containing protein
MRQTLVPPTPAAAVRHDLLLGAAAHAAEVLTATPDLQAALAEAGRVLGEATGVDRVNVFRYDHARAAGFLHAEWARPGVTPLSAIDPGPYADIDYAEVMRPLRAGQVYHAPLREKTGANAALNAAAATKTDLFVPVLVDGRFWGMLNFDDCTTERAWSDGEVEVLRAATAAVAAAVRREALERAHAEAIAREREQAALERAAELARRNALLAVALDASRALIEAVDLGVACDHVLAALGPALAADRAALGVLTPARRRWRALVRAAARVDAPGVPRQSDDPVLRRTRLAGANAQLAAFLAGEPFQATLDALPEPARAEQAAAGVRAAFAVPVVVDGAAWGVLGFDDCRQARTWDADEVGFLRIVAAALAAAVQRHRARARARGRRVRARAGRRSAGARAVEGQRRDAAHRRAARRRAGPGRVPVADARRGRRAAREPHRRGHPVRPGDRHVPPRRLRGRRTRGAGRADAHGTAPGRQAALWRGSSRRTPTRCSTPSESPSCSGPGPSSSCARTAAGTRSRSRSGSGGGSSASCRWRTQRRPGSRPSRPRSCVR